jgi:hypothetical protein
LPLGFSKNGEHPSGNSEHHLNGSGAAVWHSPGRPALRGVDMRRRGFGALSRPSWDDYSPDGLFSSGCPLYGHPGRHYICG